MFRSLKLFKLILFIPLFIFRVEVSSEDVVLEGGASGSKVSISLTAQGNTLNSANGC